MKALIAEVNRQQIKVNKQRVLEIEDMKLPIPPLLLIPLVENAFKHGVSETRNKPFLNIQLTANQLQLEFVVINSTEKLLGEGRVKENIGLSNL